jgi:multiple antibiotic resistance protein
MTDVEYLKFFVSLLAIVNPIGAIPIFIGLTQQQDTQERWHTAAITATSVAVVLTVALLTGERILAFFGISFASFRVGGGILVLLIAISMLHARVSPAKQTEEEAQDAAEKEAVAVVPLGIPLLAGPGAISTIILYAQRGDEFYHYLFLEAVIILVALVVWISFRAAPRIAGVLGRTGINVVTRIMGLMMAAIAVEIMASGLRLLFPGLG